MSRLHVHVKHGLCTSHTVDTQATLWRTWQDSVYLYNGRDGSGDGRGCGWRLSLRCHDYSRSLSGVWGLFQLTTTTQEAIVSATTYNDQQNFILLFRQLPPIAAMTSPTIGTSSLSSGSSLILMALLSTGGVKVIDVTVTSAEVNASPSPFSSFTAIVLTSSLSSLTQAHKQEIKCLQEENRWMRSLCIAEVIEFNKTFDLRKWCIHTFWRVPSIRHHKRPRGFLQFHREAFCIENTTHGRYLYLGRYQYICGHITTLLQEQLKR